MTPAPVPAILRADADDKHARLRQAFGEAGLGTAGRGGTSRTSCGGCWPSATSWPKAWSATPPCCSAAASSGGLTDRPARSGQSSPLGSRRCWNGQRTRRSSPFGCDDSGGARWCASPGATWPGGPTWPRPRATSRIWPRPAWTSRSRSFTGGSAPTSAPPLHADGTPHGARGAGAREARGARTQLFLGHRPDLRLPGRRRDDRGPAGADARGVLHRASAAGSSRSSAGRTRRGRSSASTCACGRSATTAPWS